MIVAGDDPLGDNRTAKSHQVPPAADESGSSMMFLEFVKRVFREREYGVAGRTSKRPGDKAVDSELPKDMHPIGLREVHHSGYSIS